MVMGFLLRRRRCICGCDLGPRHSDVFRGLKLVMFLCLESICILVGKMGRSLKNWACQGEGDRHDLEVWVHNHELGLLGLPVNLESWKCDQCGKIGKGNANSLFALEEIDHFLDSRCRGSLRIHVVPEPASDLLSPPALPVGQEAGRTIVVGLGKTWVEAGQTLFINAGTPEAFKVRGLIVPSSVAAQFTIEGISIRTHQLLESSLPAVLFTESWQQQPLRLECDVAQDELVTVTVANRGREGMSFQGALVGLALTEPGHLAIHGLSGGSQIAAQELTDMLKETSA